MPRKRSLLSQIRRDTYLINRALGDVQAAQRGPGSLAKRVARRRERRFVWGLLRKLGL